MNTGVAAGGDYTDNGRFARTSRVDPASASAPTWRTGNTKGACKSSWSRIRSLKSFTLTTPWDLAKLVKIFPGIFVRLYHTDRKQMGLLKEQCAE